MHQRKLRIYNRTVFIYYTCMDNRNITNNYITNYRNEKLLELKQIAEKIAELDAKFRAMRLMGNVDGAMSAKRGLKFAKQVFAQKQKQLRGVSR